MTAPARPRLVKVLVPVLVVIGVAFAFWRTVHSARSAPYTLAAASAQAPWRLAIGMVSQPNDPALLLEPPPGLSRELFDQVFKRSMESMQSPAIAGIPLVLAGELGPVGSARLSPDALLAMARAAGLEGAPPVPRCLAHLRQPEPDARQQAYLAIFDTPAFATFRGNLAARLGPGFDAGAATPALLLGVVESPLERWLPLRADAAKDCVAPITLASPS
jgi:hypothetical protein